MGAAVGSKGESSDATICHVPLQSGRQAIIHHWRAAGESLGSIGFSHGSYSAPWKYERLIGAWHAAGYDVWAPLHVDSVDHPLNAQYPMSTSWLARVEDMHAVSLLIGSPYVAAGHSYGALAALVLGGAEAVVPETWSGPLCDPLVRCVIALSPPPAMPGLIAAEGYAGLSVPALIQTGDRDLMPGWPETDEGWRVHLAAYERARSGEDRYLLVLDGVDHYFGSAICEPDRIEPPQLAQLAEALELIQLFLNAHYPDQDTEARQVLASRLSATGPVKLERK